MDAEVSAQIGAAHGERSETRLTRRNGYRPRRWDRRVAKIELGIPKLREGSYFPSLLEATSSSSAQMRETWLFEMPSQPSERTRSSTRRVETPST